MIRRDIVAHLSQVLQDEVPEVKHVDLWNHNVEFIEQETPWERPAVFVEFGEVVWDGHQNRSLRGHGTLLLHVVTDFAGDGALWHAFELTDRVVRAVYCTSGQGFDIGMLQRTLTCHNHEELVENIEEFNLRYFRF